MSARTLMVATALAAVAYAVVSVHAAQQVRAYIGARCPRANCGLEWHEGNGLAAELQNGKWSFDLPRMLHGAIVARSTAADFRGMPQYILLGAPALALGI